MTLTLPYNWGRGTPTSLSQVPPYCSFSLPSPSPFSHSEIPRGRVLPMCCPLTLGLQDRSGRGDPRSCTSTVLSIITLNLPRAQPAEAEPRAQCQPREKKPWAIESWTVSRGIWLSVPLGDSGLPWRCLVISDLLTLSLVFYLATRVAVQQTLALPCSPAQNRPSLQTDGSPSSSPEVSAPSSAPHLHPFSALTDPRHPGAC